MKKLLVTLAVLFGSTVLVSRADIASAVMAVEIQILGSTSLESLSPSTVCLEPGEQLFFGNYTSTTVQVTEDTADLSPDLSPPSLAPGDGTGYLTVVTEGTVLFSDGSNTETLEITFSCGSERTFSRRVVVFDPAGGTCGGKSEPWVQKFKGNYALPNGDNCTKAGFAFVGWTEDSGRTLDGDLLTSIVARSKTLYAVWRPVPKAPGAVSSVVNYLCGPCSKAALSWEPSPTEGATYEVVVTGPSATNTYPSAGTTIDLANLEPGATYQVQVHAVKDGVRSDSGGAGSQTSTTVFKLNEAPIKAIAIVGERGTVSGKPGIFVEGFATGIEPGKTVIPYLRFPGQTEYTPGTARPVIQADGSFEWSRKTGKKTYVYFTSADGTVTSNRIIIAAQ